MDISQVLKALENADAAGDVEAARELARIAQGMLATAPPGLEEVTPKTAPKSGFMPAMEASYESLKGNVGALAGRTGLMDINKAEQYQKAQEEKARAIFQPTQESWTQAPLTKIGELAGGSIPYMVAPVVAGALAPQATVAGIGAAAIARTGTSLLQFAGSNLSRQTDTGKTLAETDLRSAVGAALPQALLDNLALRMIPGINKIAGAAGEKLTTEQAKAIAQQGLSKTLQDYALTTGKVAGVEGLTEAAQQVFERLQAGLNLTDNEAKQEYLDNFLGGAVLGGVLAPVGRFGERAGAKRQAAQADFVQPQQQPSDLTATEQAPEPTLRGEPVEEAEKLGAAIAPLTKQQQRAVKQQEKDQAAYLKQYEAQAQQRAAEQAEYERVKNLSPEEYAAEQMQGRAGKAPRQGATQEELNAELQGLGYDIKPENPVAGYAAQQIALARDRVPNAGLSDYVEYLAADPQQAMLIVKTATPMPGMTDKQSNRIIETLRSKLELDAKRERQKNVAAGAAATGLAKLRLGTVEEEERQALQAQRDEEKRLSGEAETERRVAPEILAVRGLGRPENLPAYRGEPKKISERIGSAQEPLSEEETQLGEDPLINKLVEAFPIADRTISPGDVYLGLGTRKQDVRDLQAQLAIARLTRDRDQQNEIKRQLDEKRAIPTEGGLGTKGGKTAAEYISRSKLPEMRVNEAEADKHASSQRNTLLGMARTLASKTIMLPEKREAILRDAKEKYIAQHAAEIEARRKAFGLPPMADWEIAEARARALEGLNTLTNNWDQFVDKVISVKALQNITREAVYQNLYKAVQRKQTEQQDTLTPKLQAPAGQKYYYEDQEGNRIEGKTMETPRQTGPRIAGPKELTLKSTPNIAATDADAAKQFIEQVLSQVETKGRTRVEPTTTEKPSARVGDLASIATLFKQAKTGGKEVDLNEATVGLLDNLRKGLRTNNDPEFVSLARETAQRIAEGNLPSEYDVRDLDEMMKAHEAAGRSETRPGATPEELQRTSAQPQKDLFPEAAVQVQRATPANFQKMLDSKDIQGMRESLAQAKADNQAALEQISKYVPSVNKELRAATTALNEAKAKAETLSESAAEQRKEPKWYAPAVRQVVELESVLTGVPMRLEALRDIQRGLRGLNAKDRADLVQLAEAAKQSAGAPDTLQNFNDIIKAAKDPASLTAEIEKLDGLVKRAASLIDNAREKLDSLMTSYQQDVVLRRSIDRQAKKAAGEVESATKRLREAQAAYRKEREAEIKAEAAPDETTAVSNERYKKAAQAGREGLGLEGERIERDTSGLAQEEQELRSKIGSLEDQLTKVKSAKKKAEIQEKIDATEAELAALPEKAPVQRKRLGEKTDADIAFEAEQIANARKLNKKLGITGGLPAPIKGPIEKDVRTGKTTQSGKRKDLVGRANVVTNALLARRAELSELDRRVSYLEENNKPVPAGLAKQKARAEQRVDKARKVQEGIAAEDKATRKALGSLEQRRITDEMKRAEKTGTTPKWARGVEVESPNLSDAQVAALEKNNITKALDDLANDKNASKLNQVVSARLAALLGATNVEIKDTVVDEDGNEVLGSATSKNIELNRNGGLSQEILLHEGTHAATERVIQMDENLLTRQQLIAKRELMALHASVKNDPRFTSVNAKSSLSEFVAEVMSNRNLQEQMREKKWKLSDAWEGFKSTILRMLGIERPETMLGAALQSVDALMMPSSVETRGTEKPVSRRLSQKDIAALHDGSNSMKQFAEQFGTTEIKQKDRTVEDANRIGRDYLDDMYAKPMDYVAEAEESKLDYSARMSDGKEYTAENPLHYVEAEAATYANLKAQEDPALRQREALSISMSRKKDLRSLIKNMMETPEFTFVEQALVAKAASKYAVLSDKTGRLKLASIEPNNRHSVAVVSSKDAAAIIEELRAGKSLKAAFLEGMQKNANRNAKLNETRNGWYKFDQTTAERNTSGEREPGRAPKKYKDSTNLEQAAIKLNAACAGTPWCTGATVTTARHQIENGDFYVYYQNGNPEVAVRMDGTEKIGEVRGNSPNQALTADQQAIAEQFLTERNFEGAQVYVDEINKKRDLIAVAKGEKDFSLDTLFANPRLISDDGKLDTRAMDRMLAFKNLDGYVGRPEPDPEVREFFAQKFLAAGEKAYANGYFFADDVDANDKSATAEGRFNNKDFTIPVDELKGAKEISMSSYGKKQAVLPALERISSVHMFGGELSLPALNYVPDVVVFNSNKDRPTVLTLPSTAVVDLIRPVNQSYLQVNGAKTIRELRMRTVESGLHVFLPDAKFVNIDQNSEKTMDRLGLRARSLMREHAKKINLDLSDSETRMQEGVLSDDDLKVFLAFNNLFISRLNGAAKRILPKDMYRTLMNSTELEMTDTTLALDYYDNFAKMVGTWAEDANQANKLVVDMFNEALEPEEDYKKFKSFTAEVIAPSMIAAEPAPEPKNGEAPIEPRVYARKATAPGMEEALNTANSLIASPKTIGQQVKANLGLEGRTQFIDRLAPLEHIAHNVMKDSLIGTQMMYYLRMADQKMSYVQQAVGHGVPQRTAYKRKDGQTEYLIEGKDGANLAGVVKILKDAPNMNAEAANQLFTMYLLGKRAERVGYDKLNFKVDSGKIKTAVAQIESNKELAAVFKRAQTEYNSYNRDLMKFLKDTGVLSPEIADQLASTNDYIPYYRERGGNVELLIGGEGVFRVGNLKEQPQLRELVGGEEKVLDFMTSSVQNTSMIMDAGLRNIAAKNAMFNLAEMQLAQFLGGNPSGPDIVSFKDHGVDRYVRVKTDAIGIPADLLVKGMEGIPVNNSALVKLMGAAAQGVRKGVMLNPMYPVKQLFRDSFAAPMASGADFIPVLGALRQLGKSATKTKLEARGITGGQVFTGTNQDLTRILKDLQEGRVGLGQFIAKAEAIAMEADASTRRAQYESYIQQGLSEMEATLMSLEAMNFNRRGLSPSMHFLSTVIPFFNAQVQSMDVLYRALTGKMPMNERLDIQGKLLRRGSLLAMTAVGYAMMMQDDEAYKNANPEEKYGNFFISVPGLKEPLRFPVPFEIGYIFKGIPEAMVNIMANEKGSEEAYKAFKSIAIQTVPGGTSLFLPAGIKPIVENVTNYSFFTGRSLESTQEEAMLPAYRYRSNTSEVAKLVGKTFDVSPIKVENLIRGYTGTMGVALAQSLNMAIPTTGGPEEATKRITDVPVIGGMFQPTDAAGIVNATYDRMEDLRQHQKTFEDLVRDGRMAEAQGFYQEHAKEMAGAAVAGNARQHLGEITKAMNAVKASNMEPDKKRALLDRLQGMRIKIAESYRKLL
jgi:hypothetical protein